MSIFQLPCQKSHVVILNDKTNKNDKSDKCNKPVLKKEFIVDNKEEYDRNFKEFSLYIKLKSLSTDINILKNYTKSITYLDTNKYKFTEKNINSLYNQLCKKKKSSLISYEPYDIKEYIILLDQLLHILIRYMNFNCAKNKTKLDEIILYSSPTIMSKVYTYITLYHMDIMTDKYANSMLSESNELLILPFDISLSCNTFKELLRKLNHNMFRYVNENKIYYQINKIREMKNLEIAKKNYSTDNLIIYLSNIVDGLQLNAVCLINTICKEILNSTDKHKLISKYIDKHIEQNLHEKYHYETLNILCFDNLTKIYKHIEKKQYYELIISYVSNKITNNIQDYESIIMLYIQLHLSTETNFSYADIFIRSIINKKISNYENTQYITTNPKHLLIFEEYFITKTNLLVFTIDELIYAYKYKHKHLIHYIEQKGIHPNIKCLEYACLIHIELVSKIVNEKIFPNDICLLNAISIHNKHIVSLLLQIGCTLNEKAIEYMVSSQFILIHDLSEYGVEYDAKIYNLCCKHRINIKSIINKFTQSKALINLHLICKTGKWKQASNFAIKNKLNFDQICFNNSCCNKKQSESIMDKLIYYYIKNNTIDEESESESESESDSDHNKKITDKNDNDKILQQMCKFEVTFDSLKFAYNNGIYCEQIIQILRNKYDPNDSNNIDHK